MWHHLGELDLVVRKCMVIGMNLVFFPRALFFLAPKTEPNLPPASIEVIDPFHRAYHLACETRYDPSDYTLHRPPTDMSLKRTYAAADLCTPTSPAQPRKKATTAKSLGLSKSEWAQLKPAAVKKALRSHVVTLKREVREDWHNGYEEQMQTVEAWVDAAGEILQSVLNVGVEKGLAFEQCASALVNIADSWSALDDAPARCSLEDQLCDYEVHLRTPAGDAVKLRCCPFGGSPMLNEFSGVVWRLLLKKGLEEGVEEEMLFRLIKNAVDNDISLKEDDEEENELCGCSSAIALDALVARKNEWEGLD